MKPTKLTFIILLLLASLSTRAQQIYLDSTFGEEGIATFGGIAISSLEIDHDKNILAAGYLIENTTDFRFFGTELVLLKIKPNGDLDKNFGDNGIVITDVDKELGHPCVISIQSDNKIIVASQYRINTASPYYPYSYNFLLVRYLPDGSLDESFGDEGISTIQLNNSRLYINGFSILSLPDNSTLINIPCKDEEEISHTAIIKIKEDGSLDNSFQNDGVLFLKSILGYGGAVNFPKLLHLSDGNILGSAIFRTSLVGGVKYFYFKFDNDGNLDNTFAEEGIWTEDIGDEITSPLDFIALEQTDSKIIIGNSDVGYKRLHSNGTLDNSFNFTNKNTLLYNGKDAILQKDGKVLFASKGNSFYATRLNIDGSIDFAVNGAEAKGDYYDRKFIDETSFIASGLLNNTNLIFAKVIIDPDATSLPKLNSPESLLSISQSSDNIFIQSESPIQDIRLIDTSGRIIRQVNGNGELEVSIPIVGLPKGVYMIKATFVDNHSEVKKIMIAD